MTTSVLTYRAASNRGVFAAFVCATCIFAGAICFGNTGRDPKLISGPGSTETSPEPDAKTIDTEVEVEPDVAPTPVATNDNFVEETIAPPVRTIAKKRTKPMARPATAPRPGAGFSGHSENVALYAPRPDYPYEARRQGAVGTGLVSLTIDQGSGVVTNARMIRTIGKSILDSSALKALSRWRFRPGTASVMEIPITFTLTGASF